MCRGSSSENFQFAKCDDFTENFDSSEVHKGEDDSCLSNDQNDVLAEELSENDPLIPEMMCEIGNEPIDNGELEQVHEENIQYVMVHEKREPHYCTVCDKSFTQKTDLDSQSNWPLKFDELLTAKLL